MPDLPQCDAFGTIYDQHGEGAPDILVTLKRVEDASGSPLLLSPLTTVTDSAGVYRFTLPQDSIAYIAARATTLLSCPRGGVPFHVPEADSGALTPAFPFEPPLTAVAVLPPLVLDGSTLSIPKASATQDGYLSAADYVAFLAGAETEMGVVSFNTRTGEVTLLSADIAAALGFTPLGATIPGVAGTYENPTSITVNAKGQVIAIAGAPDTTPPDITLGTPTPSFSSAVIRWQTNEPSDSQVEYSTSATFTPSTLTPVSDVATPVTDHAVTISPLAPATPYYYRVISKDTAGNPQTSADATFTTPLAPDTTAPVITINPPTLVTYNSATVNWSTDEPADSKVDYGVALPYSATTPISDAPPSMTTSHHVALSGLLSAQLYHYRVISKDVAGNERVSLDQSFMTGIPPDLTAPIITLEAETAVMPTSVMLNWSTDELSDSQVEYSLSPTFTPSTSTPITDQSPSLVTAHHVPLSGLLSETTYYYRVKSRDAALNQRISADATFMTAASSGVDLLTGLVSYWKFEEASGTRFDSHGSNHLDRLFGAVLPQTVAGRSGNGVKLNADDVGGNANPGYLGCAWNASQDFPGDFTIAGWIYITELQFYSNIPCLLSCWGTPGSGLQSFIVCYQYTTLAQWQLSVSSDGFDQIDCIIATDLPFDPRPGQGLGVWMFICAKWKAATGDMSIEINNDGNPGTLNAGFTGPVFPAVLGITVGGLGTDASGVSAFGRTEAVVDEVAIYNRLLTDAECAALYAGETPY